MSILGKRSKPDASISHFYRTALELESGDDVYKMKNNMKFTSFVDLTDMSFSLINNENGTHIYFYPEHDDIGYKHYYKHQNQNQSHHHGKVYTRHHEEDQFNYIGNMWSVLKKNEGIRYFVFEYKHNSYSSEKKISTELSVKPDCKYQNIFYALRYLVENILSK